ASSRTCCAPSTECSTLAACRYSEGLELGKNRCNSSADWRTAALVARLRGKRRQLKFVRPTGLVLCVQIVECLRNFHGIHYDLWSLPGARQSPSARRIDQAIDHHIGHMHTVFGILFRQHLRERAHHYAWIVQ